MTASLDACEAPVYCWGGRRGRQLRKCAGTRVINGHGPGGVVGQRRMPAEAAAEGEKREGRVLENLRLSIAFASVGAWAAGKRKRPFTRGMSYMRWIKGLASIDRDRFPFPVGKSRRGDERRAGDVSRRLLLPFCDVEYKHRGSCCQGGRKKEAAGWKTACDHDPFICTYRAASGWR